MHLFPKISNSYMNSEPDISFYPSKIGITPYPLYTDAAVYPFDGGKPVPDQTALIRMRNPGSYAYFAAHIWREMDNTALH